ncbi:acyl carrier protein [Kangiella sp. HZ709]|uniref:acyl carrier protein n=1 Tax=Kangiella sp. HZ709 TaxID=2666328 RepID=UPI0012AFA8EA|nr:phosphopantetheine-binding protein [Kangiella sp. HZ709]MRX28064.1 acyl carrier protein [Kangiella sp. HZ709]
MSVSPNLDKLIEILSETLSIDAEEFSSDTLLLGNFPEFDSMAIVSILMELEEQFSISVAEDELTGDAFESVSTLLEFIDIQQAATAI